MIHMPFDYVIQDLLSVDKNQEQEHHVDPDGSSCKVYTSGIENRRIRASV